MKATDLILNTHAEDKFAVWNGKEWIKFMVSGNKTYHKDSSKDFWLVTSQKSKKEHKMNCDKGQELFDTKKLKLL